jgi:hypothetical protein
MYHKGSCRACGTHLTPTSVCNICNEHITWTCNKCDKMEDVTHEHTYCRLYTKREK